MKRTDSEACEEWVEILVGGREVDEPRRRAAEEHLAACARCQRDMAMIGPMDRLLGAGTGEDHPSSSELVAHAAGEGQAARRQAIAEHLAACPACGSLVRGAAAGLAEAGTVEAGLALARAMETPDDGLATHEVLHLPLSIPLAQPPRALAADPSLAGESSVLPSERRVLLEQEALRLVYLQVGGRGQLGLFGSGQAAVPLSVALDGEELSPLEQEPEARVYDLGPVARLRGRTLAVSLGPARRSWTLIPEASGSEP